GLLGRERGALDHLEEVVDAGQPEELLDVPRALDDREALSVRAGMNLSDEHGREPRRVHEGQLREIDHDGPAAAHARIRERRIEPRCSRALELAVPSDAEGVAALLRFDAQALLRHRLLRREAQIRFSGDPYDRLTWVTGLSGHAPTLPGGPCCSNHETG